MRLTLITHSTVAVEAKGTVLMTDPVLRGHVAFLRRTSPPVRPALLQNVRGVLVSHLHHDHCDVPSLARIGRSVTLLVPAGTEQFFHRRRFADVRPMGPGDRHVLDGVVVTATEADHDGARRPWGSGSASLGFLVEAGDVCAYFAGDTDLFTGMEDLGQVDVGLLPVAGWGRTLGPGHMDALRAAQAVRMIGPRVVVPIHWDGLRPCWHRQRSQEHARAAPLTFAAEVRRLGLPTRVEIVPPGSSIDLDPGP